MNYQEKPKQLTKTILASLVLFVGCVDKVGMNDSAPPNPVEITRILYLNDRFHIFWRQAEDQAFYSYTVLESVSHDMADPDTIGTFHGITDTSLSLPVEPNIRRYYFVSVCDQDGNCSSGNPKMGSSLEKILFMHKPDTSSYFHAFQIDIDGENLVQLTSGFHMYDLKYRRDGAKLLIDYIDLFSYDLLTNELVQLTALNDSEYLWNFSSSLRKIAIGISGGMHSRIDIINYDGSNPVTIASTMEANPTLPSFSPDGNQVCYSFVGLNFPVVYVSNVDGTNTSVLTSPTDITRDYSPSFSPDGTKIVFVSDRDGNDDIFIMNADGSDQINLTNDPYLNTMPIFSPDNSKIAYLSYYEGQPDIFIMNLDGSDVINLTNDHFLEYAFVFSSNSEYVIFASDRENNKRSIFRVGIDGSGLTKLAEGRKPSIMP
jgi:Tol biopolymer transport system component